MITITTKTERPDWKADREPIFSIDGVEYTIPKKVPTNVGLEAMEKVSELGGAAGTRWLMVLMLGQKGWDALRTCEDLEPADLQAVQEVIRTRVFAEVEPEGKN